MGICHGYPRSIPRRVGRSMMITSKLYLRNLFLRKVDLIFSVSNYIKKLLKEMGIIDERIHPVGSGIDYDYIQSVKSEEKLYDACFLGAIEPRKGVFDLPRLWKEIVKKKTYAKLLIMGAGGRLYFKRLKELISKYDLQGKLIMTGFVRGEQKYKLLKQSRFLYFQAIGRLYHRSSARLWPVGCQ